MYDKDLEMGGKVYMLHAKMEEEKKRKTTQAFRSPNEFIFIGMHTLSLGMANTSKR